MTRAARSFAPLTLPLLLLAAPTSAQTPLFVLEGSGSGTGFGRVLAAAGDVDGDGCSDLAVAAPNDFTAVPNGGIVRVYSGQSGHLIWGAHGPTAFDFLGSAVDGVGDIDGDGRDDLAIGARGNDANGSNAGAVFLYAGAFSGSPLIALYGDKPGDAFGTAVARVGDTNGDGVADFAVGMPGSDVVEFDGGAVRVFSGATGAALFTHYGTVSGERLGTAVAPAGDLDGDGRADVLVSAIKGTQGTVRVISGATAKVLLTLKGDPAGDDFGRSIACVGDANGDGRPDFLVGAPLAAVAAPAGGAAYLYSGANGALIRFSAGDAQGDRLGTSVAAAGDVDQDGRADYAVGIPGQESKTAVGSIDPETGQQTFLTGFDVGAVRIHSGATGALLSMIEGKGQGGLFGWSLALVGDANCDGIADFAAGALLEDRGVPQGGTARVFSSLSLPASADRHELSLAKGGDQVLSLAIPKLYSGEIFWVIGGTSGTTPGYTTPDGHLPINVDVYTALSVSAPFAGALHPPLGLVDANGMATSELQIPAGTDSSLAGITLHHVFALFDDLTGQFIGVSNPLPLTLLP